MRVCYSLSPSRARALSHQQVIWHVCVPPSSSAPCIRPQRTSYFFLSVSIFSIRSFSFATHNDAKSKGPYESAMNVNSGRSLLLRLKRSPLL